MSKDTKILVCDKCLCACCIQGEFYCDEYRDAGTTCKTVGELVKLGLESPDYFKANKNDKENSI